MANANAKKQNMQKLTECAIMLALSIVLSFITIIKMPMGGSVTLLSMLPICLISVKYGLKTGLPVAFLFAVFKLVKGVVEGNVFVYIEGIVGVAVCVLFDYIVPFTGLGLAGVFRKRGKGGAVLGIVLVIVLRFVCHYVTGVYIWGQWAENMSKYLYSLVYNGQYMLPECIITGIASAVLVNIPQIRKLLGLRERKTETAAEQAEETYTDYEGSAEEDFADGVEEAYEEGTEEEKKENEDETYY